MNSIGGTNTVPYSQVFLQSDAKILVTGQVVVDEQIRIAVFRLNADGTPNASYDGDGTALVTVSATNREFLGKSILQPDGKLLIAGGTATPTGFIDSIFVRVNTGGSLDPSFGTNGIALFDFYPNNNDQFSVLALQPDGKIVAPVSARNAGETGVLATGRFNADGSLDTTYGTNGIFRTTRTNIGVNDFIRQPDGKFIFVGFSTASGYSLGRFNADGSLDTAFAPNGIVNGIRYGTSTTGLRGQDSAGFQNRRRGQ